MQKSWKNWLPGVGVVLAAILCSAISVVFFRDPLSLSWDMWVYSGYSDGKVYAKLLHLKNGDPLSRVVSLLGKPLNDNEPQPSSLIETYRRFMDDDAHRFPDGVEDSDAFFEFCCVQAGSVWLQFRHGMLINYDPTNFRDLLDYK